MFIVAPLLFLASLRQATGEARDLFSQEFTVFLTALPTVNTSLLTDQLKDPHYESSHLLDLTTRTAEMMSMLATASSSLPRQDFFAPEHAVFYNLFVKSQEDDDRVFKLIVNKQADYIIASKYDTVYYNPIGYNSSLPVRRDGLRCKQLRYLPVGGEMETLQDMHGYCESRPNATVAYLHIKGSYHNNAGNDKVRHLATRSALHDVCHNIDRQQYNACSFDFEQLPLVHTSGNMFFAKCSYIRTRLPPKEYERQKLNLFHQLLTSTSLHVRFKCTKECVLESTPYDQLENWLSVGRYSAEAWLISSPRADPCV